MTAESIPHRFATGSSASMRFCRTGPTRRRDRCRIGSPAVTCSTSADFADTVPIGMVRRGWQAKCTSSARAPDRLLSIHAFLPNWTRPPQDAATGDPQKPWLFGVSPTVEKGHGGLFPNGFTQDHPPQDAATGDPQKPWLFGVSPTVEKGHGGLFPNGFTQDHPPQDAATGDPQKPWLFGVSPTVEKGHGGLFPRESSASASCSGNGGARRRRCRAARGGCVRRRRSCPRRHARSRRPRRR
jgi:hypothetical protein